MEKSSRSQTGTLDKPVLFLLERFPVPDKERVWLELYAPHAREVLVAGSFNCWQTSATPLQKRAGGRWTVELMLASGWHEYRFIVDGQWADDPWSPACVLNPFGGWNGLLRVGLQT